MLRTLLLKLLTWAARGTDRFRAGGIPVWVYHSLDESGSPVSTDPARFEAWVDYLLSNGFRLIPAGQALDELAKGPVRGRTAVITFDDAYSSISDALSRLTDRGASATVFVPAGCIGGSNVWDDGRDDIPQLSIMDETELKELRTRGIEIGSHTLSHARLTETPEHEARRELIESRSVAGETVELLAYPYGLYNEAVVNHAEAAGYRGGFTTEFGVASPHTDPLAVPRLPGCFDLHLDRLIAHKGYHWYRWLASWRIGGTSNREVPRDPS